MARHPLAMHMQRRVMHTMMRPLRRVVGAQEDRQTHSTVFLMQLMCMGRAMRCRLLLVVVVVVAAVVGSPSTRARGMAHAHTRAHALPPLPPPALYRPAAGVAIQYAVPALLVLAARRRVAAELGPAAELANPHRAPWAHPGLARLVLAWAAACAALVTWLQLVGPPRTP